MYEEIRKFILREAAERRKTVAIHFQALVNASRINRSVEFCEEAGIEPTFAVEVDKMIALAKYLEKHGYRIVGPDSAAS